MLNFLKEIAIFILSCVILFVLIFIRKSCKIVKFENDYEETIDKSRPVFYFLWHRSGASTLPYLPFYKKNHKTFVTLSLNKSTKIMRFAFKILGANIIDGSKHKGYLGSIKEMMKVLQTKKNALIAITPDGPRGPEMTIKDATLFRLMKKYDAQIRFICPISNKIWEINTWDKIYIIKPFSKVFFMDHEILSRDEIQNLDEEKLKNLCEERMYSWFLKLRKETGLSHVSQGTTKKKRPNSGEDRI